MVHAIFKWLGRIARYAGYLVLLVFALAVLGSLLPAFPVLGAIGPVLIAPFAPWIVVLAIAGLVACAWRWRVVGARTALVMAVIAGFCATGATFIQARQIAVAHANGVGIDLAQTFQLGAEPHKGPPAQFLTYATADGKPLQLAVYRFAAGSGHPPAPILVYVHGGGWGAGTVRDRESDMRWFADRGYLVISVEYSLSSANQHLWNTVQPQVSCALAWINGNAARFGGDPSRVVLWGESAGGNLVLDTAYKKAAGALQLDCPGSLPRIAAAVALYPVVDVARMYRNDDVVAGPFAKMMTTNYTGGAPEQYPDRYAAVSPATYINAAAPPTLLIVGGADHLLPPAPAQDFVAKARAAKIDAQAIVVPYAEHSFDQTAGSIGNQLVRDGTLRFLAQRGLAPR